MNPVLEFITKRREHLTARIKAEEVEAALVTHPVNVSYLTGFSGESSFLVAGRDRCLLITDSRFTEQLAEECPGLELYIRPPEQNLYKAAATALTKLRYRTVACESGHLTLLDMELLRKECADVTWKPVGDMVESLRVFKDESEVAAIRQAIQFAERAFDAFRALLRPGDQEKDLADCLENLVRRVGARSTSFPCIVAVGPRSALPHAPPTDKCIGDADFLLVDWGASGPFYKSDLTRMLVPRRDQYGRPSMKKLAEVFSVVQRAQQAAIAAVRPGVKGKDVDAVARKIIEDAGYGPNFGHGLGHGLGLQVHEAPAVRPLSETVLQPGMVCTIEPGIYLPGWGGVRIEDDILITAQGPEVMTNLPRGLEESLIWL
jgi:Xaa-Pro aminopeptidase